MFGSALLTLSQQGTYTYISTFIGKKFGAEEYKFVMEITKIKNN